MRKSNYDKFPVIKIGGHQECHQGWSEILKKLKASLSGKGILVIECYHGVNEEELETALKSTFVTDVLINAQHAYKAASEIDEITFPDVTDDRVFGYRTRLKMDAFLDTQKVASIYQQIAQKEAEIVVVYGSGASCLVPDPKVLVYADMARWEIQQRMRRGEVSNLGVKNFDLEVAQKYKRAFFVDWLVCDRIKRATIDRWDYVLDTNKAGDPKMIPADIFQQAMHQAVSQPFRVVPFFDPGPWGGQWMREVFDLDKEPVNFAWCFDCVPEENSVLFQIGDTVLEFPASNLVYFRSRQLLGEGVYARFGPEFPIRFDFLDTMDGGNLSLQVHPLTEYIQEYFGMYYTQDESYYMLDAGEDATVYLGLREDVNPDLMLNELYAAQEKGQFFDADKHVEKWPAKKHDHFLIPAGTVHCSGKDSMVLEISATPFIFTFKLWDWGRLGLDGLPRPINIERGEKSIVWDRRKDWTEKNLINRVEPLAEGDGWRAERTGLHETEFIETIRHWFTKPVAHDTEGNLNVLNLVQGREAIIESPTGSFAPFVVHYAETFIIPAQVGPYTIRPYGEGLNEECATIKAFVKF